MQTGYYDIHDIVKYKLNGPKNFVKFSRYSNYKTKHLKDDEIDFSVNIKKFNPKSKNCNILDGKYYVKKDYIYCKESYKAFKWEIELENFENGNINVNINIKSFPKLKLFYTLIEGFIIDALIHYVISTKLNNLIHASCVDLEGNGILFVARGGAGKTTISTNLINKGFNFISDNYTILKPDGTLMGFVEPLNLFTYNSGEMQDKIKITQNIELKINYLIYKITGGYVKIFTKMNPFDILSGKIKEKTNLNALFLIIPSKKLKKMELSEISKVEMIEHIIFNQKIEFPFFNRYITAYSYVYPDSEFSNHWKSYKKNLNNNLNLDIPLYKICVPLSYENNVFNDIQKVIENEAAVKL